MTSGTKTAALAVAALLLGSSLDRAMAAASHPLDPLSADELRAATRAMRADPRLKEALFPQIALREPAKAEVLAWRPGEPVKRQARAVAMNGASVFEVVVDLDGGKLAAVTERQGVEAPITLTEYLDGVGVALENPEFREGLAKRGVTDLEKVFCAPFAAGYYGIPEHDGRRLLKVGCFDTRRTTNNLFGWPIERLYALVDLREHKVLQVVDQGVVPINEGEHNFTEAAVGQLREPQKPTLVAQPAGANFTIDGHQVTWGNWRFHVRLDPRVGTVVSLARWQANGGEPRPVLYEGYLSEMFVPYMDADYGWYSRTYFDSGEYGAGLLASTLKPGVDCPATATFLPAVLNDDKGEPFETPDALCVFERSLGEPAWRHAEVVNQTHEGRPAVELVVRMAAQIGNYDYLLDWAFNHAAEIDVRVGATGVDALKGVPTRTMADATAAEDTRHGTLVAPGLVAVNHDHHFNFRLDLDVDGPENSFNHDVYKQVTLPADSPRRSVYVVEPHVPETERAARLDTGHGPAKLRVVNEGKANGVGNPVSYELLYANHAELLLDPSDWPARRARFLEHDVWVTPNDPAQRHAGGDYMFVSRETGGLPVWTEADRPVRKRDIVVWANLGMHHLPRAEDMPVMPMVWHGFKLRPHNFFDRNPAIDLPTGFATQ
jgi:primary-amine oxidase